MVRREDGRRRICRESYLMALLLNSLQPRDSLWSLEAHIEDDEKALVEYFVPIDPQTNGRVGR